MAPSASVDTIHFQQFNSPSIKSICRFLLYLRGLKSQDFVFFTATFSFQFNSNLNIITLPHAIYFFLFLWPKFSIVHLSTIEKVAKKLNEMQGPREMKRLQWLLSEIFSINAIKATRRQGQQDDSSCPATIIWPATCESSRRSVHLNVNGHVK